MGSRAGAIFGTIIGLGIGLLLVLPQLALWLDMKIHPWVTR